jgi:uncharacterized protein YgbK (DUF1537 family)
MNGAAGTSRGATGCIADDISGATDLASALAARGLDTRLFFRSTAVTTGGDALVVALKIRSIAAAEARQAATEAAEALRAAGVTRLFSKYCSTFDSTPEGNIGPIADALIDVTGAGRVVHCPAYPANGRTVYLGHLFVGDQLLSESSMRDHPLNPMRDSQLLHVLGAQTRRRVALVRLGDVAGGVPDVAERLAEIGGGIGDRAGAGDVHHVIGDAVCDVHVATLADAVARDPLAAGGAAFGAAFAAAASGRAGAGSGDGERRSRVPAGPAAILVGSMSRATREQVATFGQPALALTVEEMIDGDAALARMMGFLAGGDVLDAGPVLLYPDADASAPRGNGHGPADAEVARGIERTLGRMSVELVRLGVRRLVVAGGETSGAVADALGLQAARIGPDISVGVPWVVAEDRELGVAFKSGNFGGPTFFRDALRVADE